MTMDDRAFRALVDVVAVERVAPGMVRVVTWSDEYTVDARHAGCGCPDQEYNLDGAELCKHEYAARVATSDVPAPYDVEDSLAEPSTPAVATDGGEPGMWTVYDSERDNANEFDTRADAEDAKSDMEALGADVTLHPPGEDPQTDADGGEDETDVDTTPTTDGGQPEDEPTAEVVDVQAGPGTDETDVELPERSVAEDPLSWVPGEFVDEIDGSQAINRKGFEVLSHFYDVDVAVDLQVAPEETDHEYARVKATAVDGDGRECQAFGSAHVDRGDDSELLLEMADTRARKRALSIATGVGAVAVAELKNEVQA